LVEILGVRFDELTEAQTVRRILDAIDERRGGVVVTPNLDHLRRCSIDATYRTLVAKADLVVADGMPIVWASRVAGQPLPERVTGADLVASLSAGAAERGRSVFLLGGDPGTAEGAARVLSEGTPRLKVAGTWFPPRGFERDPVESRRLEAAVSAAAPDVVFVGLGSPKQELLIDRIRSLLPAAWWLGVGISFSLLTGEEKRAPAWMRRSGFEWLHRLACEPRRLYRRYLVDGLPFALRLAAWSVRRRFRRRGPAHDGTAAPGGGRDGPVNRCVEGSRPA